jgi:hypothetical protein
VWANQVKNVNQTIRKRHKFPTTSFAIFLTSSKREFIFHFLPIFRPKKKKILKYVNQFSFHFFIEIFVMDVHQVHFTRKDEIHASNHQEQDYQESSSIKYQSR